ncbi:MAG: hypothetical protein OXC98_10445 [bacterium]|nr:hypothetical protein [Acidimicrobiia bacterium]MCY4650768.1 hypothetical protein [bacterium]
MLSNYQKYTADLQDLLLTIANDGVDQHLEALASAVDGQAAAELRNLVGLSARREQGAFFTTGALRAKAVPTPPHDDEVVYFDPACGAGDLLVESAKRLPVSDSLGATVQHWGEHLLGCDVEPLFVETTKLRLLLTAAYRTGQTAPGEMPRDAFPSVVVGDGHSQERFASRCHHIVLNPPFGYVEAPAETQWAKGRVSGAAVFLAKVLQYAPAGVTITAILPDVLRSGTRYRKWRSMVESMMEISDLENCGLFDEETDVDVFILRGTRSDGSAIPGPWAPRHDHKTVGDFFDVHVGAVVPHRDPKTGPRRPFIWPRRLPLSGSFDPGGKWRRFSGRTFDPPFVAIRRTSRPGQKRRAGGVLIVGDSPVAVENHLLVAVPKNGAESECLELMEVLAAPGSREWLDQQIRTRHLTVSSVSGLPWPDDDAHV